MGITTKPHENSHTHFLEVVNTQVIFDNRSIASQYETPFKIIVNPAGFCKDVVKEVTLAKIGLSDQGAIKFFFEKVSICEQLQRVFFFRPTFRLSRNMVLPAELLIYFSLPYHVIEKGDYPILQDDKYFMIAF